MCIQCMKGMKTPRMSYGTETQNSLSQSCQSYSTWIECSSETHNSCQHQHFPLPKAEGSQRNLKKRSFFSQTLEAVTLLSYDMPIETKRVVANSVWWYFTSDSMQDFQKATGFKMLLSVTVTLAKQAWNLQWIKDGIFGKMSSFKLKVIARDAIAMNIVLLFQASENNLNSLKPTRLCNTPFLSQNLSNMSLPLFPSYKSDIGMSVTGVKHYSAVFTWTGVARYMIRYNKML